jgi:hypothetical protein
MKTRLTVLAIGLAGMFSLSPFRASAVHEVSVGVSIGAVGDFYAPLTPYGAWVEVSSYGRCWHPASVAVDWRPYGYGHWVWTDCGWYWESDEPWAWACYHYGSWVYDSYYGWVWVPDTEWAPAWVSWRVGGDYIGWAPCGPRGFVVAPSFFVFVESRHFHDRVRSSNLIVNNTTIVNQTKVVSSAPTRETRTIAGTRQTVVVNQGPSPTVIQKSTGRTVTPVPIQDAVRQTRMPENLKQGQKLSPTGKETPRVFQEQPKVTPDPRLAPEPAPREQPPTVVPPPASRSPVVDPRNAPPTQRVVPPGPRAPQRPAPDREKGKGPDKEARP